MFEEFWDWASKYQVDEALTLLAALIAAGTGIYTARMAWLDHRMRRDSDDPVFELHQRESKGPAELVLRVRNRWDCTLNIAKISIVRPRKGKIAVGPYIEIMTADGLQLDQFKREHDVNWRVESFGTPGPFGGRVDDQYFSFCYLPPPGGRSGRVEFKVSVEEAGASFRRRVFVVSRNIIATKIEQNAETRQQTSVKIRRISDVVSIVDSMSG